MHMYIYIRYTNCVASWWRQKDERKAKKKALLDGDRHRDRDRDRGTGRGKVVGVHGGTYSSPHLLPPTSICPTRPLHGYRRCT